MGSTRERWHAVHDGAGLEQRMIERLAVEAHERRALPHPLGDSREQRRRVRWLPAHELLHPRATLTFDARHANHEGQRGGAREAGGLGVDEQPATRITCRDRWIEREPRARCSAFTEVRTSTAAKITR